MRYRLTPIVVTTSLLLLGTACSSQQSSEVPDPGPMPKGASFQGVWFSQEFEHMYLRQSGSEVRGLYAYRTGGRLTGTVDGNLLKFDWVDPGSKQKAQKTMSGRGYLELVTENDKKKLVGEWGYDENYTGGGPWRAEFIREIEAGDPTKIEDLE